MYSSKDGLDCIDRPRERPFRNLLTPPHHPVIKAWVPQYTSDRVRVQIKIRLHSLLYSLLLISGILTATLQDRLLKMGVSCNPYYPSVLL